MTKKEINKQLEEIVNLFSGMDIDLTKCNIQELFDYIRIGIKDLLLNLEATGRENTLLRKEIEKLK